MASTRKLTKSLTRSLTRRLTGVELEQLFLEKFKLTLSDTELIDNGDFSDLVINGDFATDSDWTKATGWSIGSGVASCDGTQTSGTSLETAANIAFVSGKKYTVTYTLTISAGSVDARLQGGTAVVGTARTSSGTYTEVLTAVSGNNKLRIRGNASFVGTVDNVAVVEGQWTGTGASISNGKLKINVTGGAYAFAYRPLSIYETGETYQVSFTVNGPSGKSMRCRDDSGNSGGLNLTNGIVALDGTDQQIEVTFKATSGSDELIFERNQGSGDWSFTVDNISLKKAIKQAPVAAFSLRKLGNVSPYACRIRRSYDNTEAQVFFDASDRVSEASVVRNTSHNLLDYSEDFTQWSTYNAGTVTSGQADPFGGNNASKIISPNANNYNGIMISTAKSASDTNYTFSYYQKKDSTQTNLSGFEVSYNGVSSKNGYYIVDPEAGTCVLTSSFANTVNPIINVESYNEDWWKISVSSTDTGANTNVLIRFYPGFSSNGTTIANLAGEMTIFAAQLEQTVYEDTPSIRYNEDFNDDTGGWVDAEGGGSITTLSHETTNPLSGSGSLKIALSNTGSSGGYPRVKKNTGTAFRAGIKYRLSFKAKALSGTGECDIRFGTSSTNMYWATNQTFTTTEQTYTYTDTFDTLPTAGTDAIQFIFDGTLGPFELLIDDLKVEEFDPIASEYISTPVVSNDGLTFTETTLDDFVGGENYITHSEAFDSWGNAAVVTPNTHPNPIDGETTADTVGSNGGVKHRTISATVPTTGTYIYSIYLKRKTGTGTIRIGDFTDGTSTVAVTNEWQRFSRATTLTAGSHTITLRIDTTDDEVYAWGAQLNTNSLKKYQKTSGSAREGNAGIVVLYNQTGGEDAIQETPAEQPLLYKEGLLVRSGSSPAWYYRDKSSGNDDVLSIPSLAGLSRLDAFFVHDSGSDTSFMYPTGSASGGKWGMLATQVNPDINWQNYQSDDSSLVFVNGTQGSPTTRGQLYNLVNGRKLVHHQNGATTSWTHFNMSDYNLQGSNGLNLDDFKFCEWIFFDTNQSVNRVAIEKDINDFHNLF